MQASAIGFGAWAIGGWMWGGADEADAIDAIHASVDAGVNLIDTAPMYGQGQSEEIVGKAIAGRRDKVVVASKAGLVWHSQKGEYFFDYTDGKPIHRLLSPESIRFEIEQSLTRMKINTIDLYQTHWQDSTTPIADTMGELIKLKDEGKILAIGASNVTLADYDAYREAGPLDSLQERYSMLDRKLEDELLPACERDRVAMLAYSPLEQGLLTGKVTPDREFDKGDQRLESPRFSVENRKRVLDMLAEFQPIADAAKITLAQLVIAWTVEQPGLTHALVGARNREQALANAKAGDVYLEADQVAAITTILEKHAAGIE